MTVEDLDIEGLDDEALDAMLAGEGVEETDATPETEQEAPAAQGNETTADPAPEQPADESKPKDDGPGDLRVALKQERERRQQVQAELQAIRDQQAQAQAQWEAQQRMAQRQAELEQAILPEEQAALVQRYRSEDAAMAQAQAHDAYVQSQYRQGEELAREAYPDFDAVIQQALADEDLNPILRATAQQALATGKNPVIAAYKAAKRLDTKAQVEAQVQARLKEILSKRQPPKSQGHTSVARLSSQSPASPERKDPRYMSDAELDAATRW